MAIQIRDDFFLFDDDEFDFIDESEETEEEPLDLVDQFELDLYGPND